MKLFDFRYKGLRVKAKHTHLMRDYILSLFAFFFVTNVIMTFSDNVIFKSLDFNDFALFLKQIFVYLVALALASIVFVGLVLLILPITKRILTMQRICKMMYDSKFYLVNNFEDNNMMTSKEQRMKKDIIYFPRIYVKMNGNKFSFTIQLDGSMFHQAGKYDELSDALERRFSVDQVGIIEKNSFLTYEFINDNEKNRLSVHDIVPKKTVIPLMKGIAWDIAKVPHGLIVGGTGGGKTVLLLILVKAFAIMGADVRIGDPKNSDLADLEKHYSDVFVNTDDIRLLVKRTVLDMNKRYADVRKMPNYQAGRKFTDYGLEPIFLILDEYVAFLTDVPKKAERDAVVNDLRQIILKGRQVGVFGIFATQRPDAKYLEGDIRDQLGLRICVGKMEEDGFRMTFGKTSQTLRNKTDKVFRGYIRIDGIDMIREFLSPFVPKEYNLVSEIGSIVRLSGSGFVAQAKNPSEPEQSDLSEHSEDNKESEGVCNAEHNYERSE